MECTSYPYHLIASAAPEQKPQSQLLPPEQSSSRIGQPGPRTTRARSSPLNIARHFPKGYKGLLDTYSNLLFFVQEETFGFTNWLYGW